MARSDSTTSASGIYLITCVPTRKFYVGSALDLKCRWSRHKRDLKNNTHHCEHLQRAWNKYGAESFEWKILEHVDPTFLLEREQHYLDLLDATKKGFNTSPTAGSCFGLKASEETKAKLSLIQRNRSPEHRAKLAAASRGRKHTPEAKAKMTKALLGRICTLEHRAKLSEAGRNQSPERRAKIAEALRGRKLSAEHRAKIGQANRGKTRTSEERAKLSQARCGKPKRIRPLPGQKEFEF